MKEEKNQFAHAGRAGQAPPPGGAPVRRRTKVVDFEPSNRAQNNLISRFRNVGEGTRGIPFYTYSGRILTIWMIRVLRI